MEDTLFAACDPKQDAASKLPLKLGTLAWLQARDSHCLWNFSSHLLAGFCTMIVVRIRASRADGFEQIPLFWLPKCLAASCLVQSPPLQNDLVPFPSVWRSQMHFASS